MAGGGAGAAASETAARAAAARPPAIRVRERERERERCTAPSWGGPPDQPRLADAGRFERHRPPRARGRVSQGWAARGRRSGAGGLGPGRGRLGHPAPRGGWPRGEGPALGGSPRRGRWATLVPTTPSAPLRTAFREAAFG
ncbi:hypothetical protein DRB96_42110 [Streptomyces sp. ICC1]|nr:hypothetical protein DRB96_42110 [Streptomyces sp. ICC1]